MKFTNWYPVLLLPIFASSIVANVIFLDRVRGVKTNTEGAVVGREESLAPAQPAAIAKGTRTITRPSVPHPLNDWEYFTYQIPDYPLVLKGRIFTSKTLIPRALHLLISGGLRKANQEIAEFGFSFILQSKDNPYTYHVPECYFIMTPKPFPPRGQPLMSYGMVYQVFQALERVLERSQRFFEASFVLVGEGSVTLGHGEVSEKKPDQIAAA
ncbi:MAG: hypothetical protein Q9220_006757 [cf. Caloplaca sp. 1 TL-2023]